MITQRLTLECGHYRLSGPWESTREDGKARHMIGDITWCEVCPRVPRDIGGGKEMMIRQVVNVEDIPPRRYRKPEDEPARARMERLHG